MLVLGVHHRHLDTVGALRTPRAGSPARTRHFRMTAHQCPPWLVGFDHPRGYGEAFLKSSAAVAMNSADSSGGNAAARRWSNQVVWRRTSRCFSRKMLP